MLFLILGLVTAIIASPTGDNTKDQSYKDQYCTDPRTMRKHAAYTEWADAYSCTRHRCQPGGRNLAIYTVGCKRVEAPESAIECEEVVEDTNMQFPFCCTRLRCLVVVRGEVWTRVLGQPWEVLPAAPWSHMYKMKKPPPTDTTFTLPKTNEQGPVYELSEPESDGAHEKMLRSGKKLGTDSPDCNEVVPRAVPPPDIVIALSTNNEIKERRKQDNNRRSQNSKPETVRHKRARKTTPNNLYLEEEQEREKDREREKERNKRIEPEIQEIDDVPPSTEKPIEGSEERLFANTFEVTPKPYKNAHHQVAWTEIPQNQWNEQHEGMDVDTRVIEANFHTPELLAQEAPEPKAVVPTNNKDEKPNNLQALVDAIGTRMRDIENVVQRMSEKVHQGKPGAVVVGAEGSGEKRLSSENELIHKHHKGDTKRPSTEADNYKRFTVRNRGSKYLHTTTDITTEQPLFIEDTNVNGYFSDASNSILRRANPPKEPPPTYMAPVENRRKAPAHTAGVSDTSDDAEKKRKKHAHKKRRGKGSHVHKKHHSKDDKRKHFNRLSSVETDKNVVSLEDSSGLASK